MCILGVLFLSSLNEIGEGVCVLKNIRIVIILIRLQGKRESEVHLLFMWDKNPVLSEDYIILHSESFVYSSEIRLFFFLPRKKIKIFSIFVQTNMQV